jgi:hypothetical protein
MNAGNRKLILSTNWHPNLIACGDNLIRLAARYFHKDLSSFKIIAFLNKYDQSFINNGMFDATYCATKK